MFVERGRALEILVIKTVSTLIYQTLGVSFLNLERKEKHDFKQYLRIRIGEVSKHSHVNEWVRRH